jgi:adenosylmethionine---8-amino-7-oxononanoate aminotransferase
VAGRQLVGVSAGGYHARVAVDTDVTWVERDRRRVWHGFTQMATYAANGPVVVDRAEGRELIGMDGRRYLDAISSLWVTTLGHRVPELDEAVRQQLDRVAHSTLLGNGNRVVIEVAEASLESCR